MDQTNQPHIPRPDLGDIGLHAGFTMPSRQPSERELHAESLLQIPLVAQLFEDRSFKFIKRGVDARWHYAGVLTSRLDGFNPMSNGVMYGHHSYLDKWLPNRHKSARAYNTQDKLINEVLFAVHDYLHAWSYRWINQLCPEIGFGTAKITRKNFELMVFCHLLTEAVATVGLDYWYLSCVDLNEVVPIGTAADGLTISYRESFAKEHRRFAPDLRVQSPDFLEVITKFYCDGVFHGFSASDLKRSPITHNWLRHELEYGKKQREYSRQWIAYLGDLEVEGDLGAPISYSGHKHTKMMRGLGDLLWAKVKQGDATLPDFVFDPEACWQRDKGLDRAFQFTNMNRVRRPSKELERSMSDASFTFLFRQYVARFNFDCFPNEVRDVLPIIKEQRSLSLGKRLLNQFDTVPVSKWEPRELFLFG